jgi:hypothetical protein
METPSPDQEASAFLAMARKLRFAFTERDDVVRPYRERYDRSQDDLRMMPDKRVEIAGAFLRATYKADHIYEDCLTQALDDYRELIQGEDASG